MQKRVMAVACSLVLLVAAGACKKKEEQAVPKSNIPGHQMPGPGMAPGMPQQPGMAPGAPGQQPNVMIPKGETKVVVPDAVKGQWKAVILEVQDKQTKKSADYTINLHSDFKIPNSNMKITVGDFLPDFRMNGLDITSVSNNPNNPAVGVKIYDGSNQVFPAQGKKWGWLYGRPEFRSMHPFENPKYNIALKNAVKKG